MKMGEAFSIRLAIYVSSTTDEVRTISSRLDHIMPEIGKNLRETSYFCREYMDFMGGVRLAFSNLGFTDS